MSVYGSINLDLIDENTEPISPNQYGLSKLLGEIDLEKTCNKSNKKLAILRLPGVIGKKMPEVFFKRLYDSILSQTEITIRSKKSQFNNAVLDSDIFHTALKIFDNQKDNKIILNHHSENILTLEKLIHYTSELIGKKTLNGKILNNDAEIVEWLLESAEVAAVPGVAFGLEPYFRVSYATSLDVLKEAMNRIEKAVLTLS